MKNTRMLAIGGSILAALIVALLVIPSFIDWSKYQSLAQEKIRAATGYDLTINGSLRMSILPSPRATVTDVVVSKPVQGKEDAFLSFGEASVRLALLPLLSGKVEVASITLDKPVVTLVTYSDGADNFKPAKSENVEVLAQDAEGKPAAAEVTTDEGQAIAINGLNIRDGVVTVRDEKAGTSHRVDIKELNLDADTLMGPFDADGRITYGKADFKVKLSTGGYRAGEALAVRLNVEEQKGRAEVKWSGVAKTDDPYEFQGELMLGFGDLTGVLSDIGMPATVPALGGRTQVSGIVTLTPDRAVLTNGNLQLANTKFALKLDVTGLKSDAKTLTAVLDTQEVLDVDALLRVADTLATESKTKKEKDTAKTEGKGEGAKTAAASSSAVKPLLPADFALPEALKGDVQLRARGIRYKGKETGAFEARATASGGKGDVRATIDSLPGGGNVTLSAATAEKGKVEGTVIAAITALKTVLSDWLGVVDAKTFDNPSMPRRIDAEGDFSVAGNTATLGIKSLSLGEPKVTGTVSYTVGARPLVNARLNANVLTLPAPAGVAQAEAEAKNPAAATPAKVESKTAAKGGFEFTPPQLPFDLKFDVSLGRLMRGDFTLSDIKAAGSYDGKGIALTNAGGTLSGGTISASGTVANLKDLAGIDMQAGLRTSDLESFVQAVTGKPLALKQKIGDFTGAVKAKGDRKKMDIDATAQARGYSIAAAGTLDDPFSPEIPGTVNIRIRHNDFVNAIRVFSPGFGSTAGGGNKPVDIAATAKINGKVYELTGVKGVLGGSDIAGALKADLSGSVPAITADITSNTLDVGALVGVESKSVTKSTATTSSASSSPTQTVTASSGGAGQWSREALDTGFLKAANVDVKLAAANLIYGTWTLTDAKGGVSMKNGVLKVSPISGKLYDGSIDATLDASSNGAGHPLNIAFKADVSKVAIGPFLQALTSSPIKRADGTGSVLVDIKAAGVSSAALMSSLTGSAKIKAEKTIVYGMDIDKLAANIVEAFDGGWKGVLAGFALEGFSGGQTAFKDIDATFPIVNGDMAINAFRMETTSSNAILITNGGVSFARWNMNLQSDVQVTQPKDVPVVGLRLTGPLNAPQKSVSSQALDNLIRAKVGDKVQDLINDKLGDKLKDTPAGNLLNQFLGGGAAPNQTSGQVPATPAGPAATPAAPAPTPDAAVTPAPVQPQPAPQKSQEQQVIEGVIDLFGRR